VTLKQNGKVENEKVIRQSFKNKTFLTFCFREFFYPQTRVCKFEYSKEVVVLHMHKTVSNLNNLLD
jgi:hypothetical protein